MSSFAELELTKTCNLACKYCYEKDYLKEYSPDAIITFEDAKNKILKYKNSLEKNQMVSVELFGGEPLLAKEVIKEILRDPELNDNIHYGLITNGTIYDEELLKLIVNTKNFSSVEISIDPPRVHDTFRVWRHNTEKGSFDHCFNNFIKMKEFFDKYNKKCYRIRTTFVSREYLIDTISFAYYLKSIGVPVFINNASVNNEDYNIYDNIISKHLTFLQMNDENNTLIYDSNNEDITKICPISCPSCCFKSCQNSLKLENNEKITLKRTNFGVFDDDFVEVSITNTGDRFKK